MVRRNHGHPSLEGCGLKRVLVPLDGRHRVRHPSLEGCGLKRIVLGRATAWMLSPLARGVRVETPILGRCAAAAGVTPR